MADTAACEAGNVAEVQGMTSRMHLSSSDERSAAAGTGGEDGRRERGSDQRDRRRESGDGQRQGSSKGSSGSGVKPGDFDWGEVLGEGSYSRVRRATRRSTGEVL